MKPLALEDILDLDTYAAIRDAYRARVIAHKNRRRVSVGPQVSVVFEDRETLRYQIQEMTRVERATDSEKVQIEVDVYNELMPGERQLSATLFIEIPDLEKVQPELDRLIGIDEHVSLLVEGFEGEPIAARFDMRQMEEDRISAVHYIRFTLSREQVEAWTAGAPAELRIDHGNYAHATALSRETLASLARDLGNDPVVLLQPREMRRARAESSDVVFENERVRARRIAAPETVERIIVEAREPHTSLIDADGELLAELMSVAQRLAREMQERSVGARVRLDLLAAEPGQLRLELTPSR
ncbi:MAG: DUF3501 family protein [Myxococcota bacterium]|nr:DUF3501 family protein [Myxococcota bacterium]